MNDHFLFLVLSLSLQVPHFSSCIALLHITFETVKMNVNWQSHKVWHVALLCGNKNIRFHTALAKKNTFLWATYIHFVFTEWFSRRWRSVSKWWQFHLSLALRHFYTSLTALVEQMPAGSFHNWKKLTAASWFRWWACLKKYKYYNS